MDAKKYLWLLGDQNQRSAATGAWAAGTRHTAVREHRRRLRHSPSSASSNGLRAPTPRTTRPPSGGGFLSGFADGCRTVMAELNFMEKKTNPILLLN